jgi:hypothetical protein
MPKRLITPSCVAGMLFIDEAHGLVANGKSDNFAKQAIEKLMYEAEVNRTNLVVVVAGLVTCMCCLCAPI